jgi:hypothetical protein
MSLYSNTAAKARPLLPTKLYPKGQEQFQVRPQGRPAGNPQAVEELRAYEVAG